MSRENFPSGSKFFLFRLPNVKECDKSAKSYLSSLKFVISLESNEYPTLGVKVWPWLSATKPGFPKLSVGQPNRFFLKLEVWRIWPPVINKEREGDEMIIWFPEELHNAIQCSIFKSQGLRGSTYWVSTALGAFKKLTRPLPRKLLNSVTVTPSFLRCFLWRGLGPRLPASWTATTPTWRTMTITGPLATTGNTSSSMGL